MRDLQTGFFSRALSQEFNDLTSGQEAQNLFELATQRDSLPGVEVSSGHPKKDHTTTSKTYSCICGCAKK